MTQEEKARAYDKALAWMRELYPGLHGATKEDAEHYFPQLRESKDERITRAINNMLPFIPDEAYTNNGVTKEDVLAWLEKHKESLHISEICKENANSFTYEDEDERIRNCIRCLTSLDQAQDVIADMGFTRQGLLSYLEKHNEQKPAEWSEEDDHDKTYEPKFKPGIKNVLKSLRPSWKPSEDEERLINTTISFLKDFADKGYENAVECIDWLKSKLNGNSCK